jgi:hypothetical protein
VPGRHGYPVESLQLGPEGAIACARGSGYTLRNPKTLEIIRENVPYEATQRDGIHIIHDQDPRCEGRPHPGIHGPGGQYEGAVAQTIPRRTIIRQYPAASLPVEAYLPTPPPEPALIADPTMMPEPPAAGLADGFTFLSAEVDASRSQTAATAVEQSQIRGDNIVRGHFNGRYQGAFIANRM